MKRNFKNLATILGMTFVVTGLFVMQTAFSASADVKITRKTDAVVNYAKEGSKLKDTRVNSYSMNTAANRIDSELADKMDEGSEEVTAELWVKDIDHSMILENAMEEAGLSTLEGASNTQIQNYIEIKRKLTRAAYEENNNKYLQGDVLYVSKYAPFIITKLSGKLIEEVPEGIIYMKLYKDCEKKEETSYSIPDIRANMTRDTYKLTGSGIKIGVVEMSYPDIENSQLADRNILLDISLTKAAEHISNHATLVTSIIAGKTQGIVPNATVYCVSSLTLIEDYKKIEWLIDQGVNIINYSAGYLANEGTYTDMAKWVDHLVHYMDVNFVKSSGNNGPEYGITDPGMAYNGITVGAIDDKDTADWLDDKYLDNTAYLETEGGFKPDFTAPGKGISAAGVTKTGTSLAAPHVVGVIAQMLQLKPELKYKLSALNALLKSGTFHKTANDYDNYVNIPNYSNKEGAGVIDALGAYNVIKANQYMQMEVNTGDLPFSKKFMINDTKKAVRVVLYWQKQNSGDRSSVDKQKLLSDMDLYVKDPAGNIVAKSETANNNTELVEFIPRVNGTYTMEVSGFQYMLNDYETIGLSWYQQDAETPTPTPTPKPTPTPVSPAYFIVNQKSGFLLDVYYSSQLDGEKVIQYGYNGGLNQQWSIVSEGNYKKIVSRCSGKVLDVVNRSTDNGARMVQMSDNGGSSQQWILTDMGGGLYKIVNRNSGKSLQVSAGSLELSASVDQSTDNGGQHQRWRIVPVN